MKQEILFFLEKIEEHLLKSDIHVDIVEKIMKSIIKEIDKNNLSKKEIIRKISCKIETMISKYISTFDIDKKYKPYVMLVCGVNGVGKTSVVGKMSLLLKKYGWNIIISECDTHRKESKQQLCDIISNEGEKYILSAENKEDTPAKIAIKSYNKAVKENKDILIIDTSGRLQNNKNLMIELLKIKQKLNKISKDLPHDVVLVVDSCCGYNAIEQATIYNNLIGITGIIATKLDISKHPGIILSICCKFNIKIFGICYGKENNKIDDLNPRRFADLLLHGINYD